MLVITDIKIKDIPDRELDMYLHSIRFHSMNRPTTRKFDPSGGYASEELAVVNVEEVKIRQFCKTRLATEEEICLKDPDILVDHSRRHQELPYKVDKFLVGWKKDIEIALMMPLEAIENLQASNERLRNEIFNTKRKWNNDLALLRRLKGRIEAFTNLPFWKKILLIIKKGRI